MYVEVFSAPFVAGLAGYLYYHEYFRYVAPLNKYFRRVLKHSVVRKLCIDLTFTRLHEIDIKRLFYQISQNDLISKKIPEWSLRELKMVGNEVGDDGYTHDMIYIHESYRHNHLESRRLDYQVYYNPSEDDYVGPTLTICKAEMFPGKQSVTIYKSDRLTQYNIYLNNQGIAIWEQWVKYLCPEVQTIEGGEYLHEVTRHDETKKTFLKRGTNRYHYQDVNRDNENKYYFDYREHRYYMSQYKEYITHIVDSTGRSQIWRYDTLNWMWANFQKLRLVILEPIENDIFNLSL